MFGPQSIGSRTHPRSRTRARALVSIAVACAVAVGACSSDDGSGPDPDPVDDATVILGAQSFNPNVVGLFRDGNVVFNNFSGVEHNVTFSGVGAPADIDDHTNASNARQFPAVGTFNFQCTLHAGMTGRVTVVDP